MGNITKDLADTVSNGGVKVAYGDPINIDGNTIVPVAFNSFGFGGGDAASDDENNLGSGGGGGGMSVPIGAYITRNGDTRFEPNLVVLLAVAIPFVCVAGWSASRIIKALKR